MKIYILPRLKDFSVAGYLRGTEGSLQWRRLCGGTTSLERYSTFSTFPTIILTNICQSNKNIFKQCKLVVRCTYSLQIPLFYKAPGPNNSRGGWRKHITRFAEDYGHQEHPYCEVLLLLHQKQFLWMRSKVFWNFMVTRRNIQEILEPLQIH